MEYIYGREDAEIVIISGYQTQEDSDKKTPFSGMEKEHYEFLFKRAGLDMDNVCVINCYPSMYRVGAERLKEYYRHTIQPFISAYKRKVVMPLGVDAVTGMGLEFSKLGDVRNKIIDVNNDDLKVIVSANPYFIRHYPDDFSELECDIALVKRVLKGELEKERKIIIRRLETPEQVRAFINSCHANNRLKVAYDTETTDKHQDTAKMVSVAFYNGEKEDDIPVVYYWAGYSKLVPKYDEQTMVRFKTAFVELFCDEYIEFIAHNSTYDDWVIEKNLNINFKQSSYDTMELKWVCDKDGKHGLKECVARYIGYPDYEEPIKADLKDIKARRNKRLCDEDINLLESLGYEPERSKTGLAKWNTKVDKGYAMYALLDDDKLERYNCYDSLFTFELYEKFTEVINTDARLIRSSKLRRDIGKELMRCQQYGMLLDVDLNEEYSEKSSIIIQECRLKMDEWLEGNAPEWLGMNVNSSKQMVEFLYGVPIRLPFAVPTINNRPAWKRVEVEKFHQKIYGKFDKFRHMEDPSKLDLDKIEQFIRVQVSKVDPRFAPEDVTIEYKDVYCRGRYLPVAFSKKTGKPSTGVAVVHLLALENSDDFLTLLLMYRKATKIKGTFLDGIAKLRDDADIVHPRFNQVGTASGRGSSSNPNGQNLIKYLRGLFKARKGIVFDFDLSQAEIRALAAESGDEFLIAAARGDIHTSIAMRIFPGQEITSEKRRQSKTIVFGIIYGIGADKLATTLSITIAEAEDLIEYFKLAFPKAYQWMTKQVNELKSGKHDYYVWTAFGTRRLIRSILSTDPAMRSHAERVAMNSPIQGDAGEYTFWIIVQMNKWLRENNTIDKARMFNTTHDSVSVDTDQDMIRVKLNDDGTMFTENGCDYVLEGGPLYEYCKNLVENPAPVAPLNTVQFKADFEARNRWAAKPDLIKALDPKEELYNWELIKGEDIIEDEDGEITFAMVA
jgi:DNA polymerase I-like protein with 3'-5' exonuclease and polymerase domains